MVYLLMVHNGDICKELGCLLNFIIDFSLFRKYLKVIYLNTVFGFRGTKLATVSGDTTVKIWDLSKTTCMHTFMDHPQTGEAQTLNHIFVLKVHV